MTTIYFFNGWAMDNTLLTHIKIPNNYKLHGVTFPYKLDPGTLSDPSHAIFIGWSFGVYYMNHWLHEHPSYKSRQVIALNGNPEVLSKYGIHPKMFNRTLATLTEENLLKFFANMDIDETFTPPTTSLDAAIHQLTYIKDHYIPDLPCHINTFIIGLHDRIIPTKNQILYCETRSVKFQVIDMGHYPFGHFKSWQTILDLALSKIEV